MGGRLETIVESNKARLFEAMLCVCVTHLYRCKTSYTLYIYMRGITGVPGGSVINEDTSPGPVQTYPRDCGDAPGRI